MSASGPAAEPDVDSRRATLGANWQRTLTFANGLRIQPFVQGRADLYNVNDRRRALRPNATIARAFGDVGADISYPLIKQTPSATWILEPLAQIVVGPNTRLDPRIPNEDSQVWAFDETNLFEVNRSPGYDLYEGGQSVTLGGRATVFLPDGRSASFLVGRRLQAEGRSGDPAQHRPPETALSDYVIGLEATPAKGITLFSRWRLDSGTFGIQRMETGINFTSSRINGYVSYLQEAVSPLGGKVGSLDIHGEVCATKHWGAPIYSIVYSGTWRQNYIGVVYRDDCLRVEVLYRHNDTFNPGRLSASWSVRHLRGRAAPFTRHIWQYTLAAAPGRGERRRIISSLTMRITDIGRGGLATLCASALVRSPRSASTGPPGLDTPSDAVRRRRHRNGRCPADAAAPPNRPPAEGVVITVNDAIISSYDIVQRMRLLIVTSGIQPTDQNLPELQREAVRSLIDEHLEMQSLRDESKTQKFDLVASDAEVNDELADIARSNNTSADQLLAQLTAQGVGAQTFRDQLRAEISWRGWIRGRYGSRVVVGDDQIKAFQKRQEGEAGKPQYEISEIFIDANRAGGMQQAQDGASQLIAQIQKGAPFAAVARQFSNSPSAANGGDVGWISTGEMPPEVDHALENLRPGQLSGAIPVKDGVYIILLKDRRAGGTTKVVDLKQAAIALPKGATDDQVAAAQRPSWTRCGPSSADATIWRRRRPSCRVRCPETWAKPRQRISRRRSERRPRSWKSDRSPIPSAPTPGCT